MPCRIWSVDWKGVMTKLSTVRLSEGQWSWMVLLIVMVVERSMFEVDVSAGLWEY